jgi:antitoxin component of RelBE/YafQ-DinJ toxin-antitoxin module
MSKKVIDYLPKRQETVLVQAKIDKHLHERAKAVLEKGGWTWHEAISGMLQKMIDDLK